MSNAGLGLSTCRSVLASDADGDADVLSPFVPASLNVVPDDVLAFGNDELLSVDDNDADKLTVCDDPVEPEDCMSVPEITVEAPVAGGVEVLEAVVNSVVVVVAAVVVLVVVALLVCVTGFICTASNTVQPSKGPSLINNAAASSDGARLRALLSTKNDNSRHCDAS